jgi:hypothetical protein
MEIQPLTGRFTVPTEPSPYRIALKRTWTALLVALLWIGVLVWIGNGTSLGGILGIVFLTLLIRAAVSTRPLRILGPEVAP